MFGEFFWGELWGGLQEWMDVCWYIVRECQVGWWLCVSSVERVSIRSLAMCLVSGQWSKTCISFQVTYWSQYGHNFGPYLTRCAFSMDWFWKSGWLIHRWALCTRIAHLPQWGPKMIWRSHESLSTSRTSQLVRKIGSVNQSVVNLWVGINWWLWERNLVSDMRLRPVQMLR